MEVVNRRSRQILELLLQDFRDEAWKDELRQIEIRRAELEATISAAKAEPPLPALHPKMADVFRHKIEHLAKALQHDDAEQRELARQTLRGFIDRIVIPPGDGLLQVVGNLGEMLAAASGRDMSTLAAVAKAGCGGTQPAEFGVLLGGCIGRLKRSLSSNAGPGSDAPGAHATLNLLAMTPSGFDFTAGKCEL